MPLRQRRWQRRRQLRLTQTLEVDSMGPKECGGVVFGRFTILTTSFFPNLQSLSPRRDLRICRTHVFVLTVSSAFVCALLAPLLLLLLLLARLFVGSVVAVAVVVAAGVPLLSVIGLAHIFHFVAEKRVNSCSELGSADRLLILTVFGWQSTP